MSKLKITDKLIINIAPIFLKLVRLTVRIKVLHPELKAQSRDAKIITFWHGKMMMPLLIHQNEWMYVLISQHKDGEIIARIVQKIGMNTIRGSSTRGGSEAYLKLVKKMKEGASTAITPDGPKGPVYKIKSGVIRLSAESGCEILLLNWYAKRKWQLKSWDRFEFPKPFSRIVVSYKLLKPVDINFDRDKVGEEIEQHMTDLENECYEAF